MVCRMDIHAESVECVSRSKVLSNFTLFVEASVKGDSERMSHILCCHYCMHEMPHRNYVSDLPFKIREELVSLMSSASNSYFDLHEKCECVMISVRPAGRVLICGKNF